jgi:hypothetical protein
MPRKPVLNAFLVSCVLLAAGCAFKPTRLELLPRSGLKPGEQRPQEVVLQEGDTLSFRVIGVQEKPMPAKNVSWRMTFPQLLEHQGLGKFQATKVGTTTVVAELVSETAETVTGHIKVVVLPKKRELGSGCKIGKEIAEALGGALETDVELYRAVYTARRYLADYQRDTTGVVECFVETIANRGMGNRELARDVILAAFHSRDFENGKNTAERFAQQGDHVALVAMLRDGGWCMWDRSRRLAWRAGFAKGSGEGGASLVSAIVLAINCGGP